MESIVRLIRREVPIFGDICGYDFYFVVLDGEQISPRFGTYDDAIKWYGNKLKNSLDNREIYS